MCKRDNFNILICFCYVYLKWNERVISDVNPASEPLQKMPKLNIIANKNVPLVRVNVIIMKERTKRRIFFAGHIHLTLIFPSIKYIRHRTM